LHYDAVGVGERELGYGYRWFRAEAERSKVPVLAANLVEKSSGRAPFKPYVIVKKGAYRVAILALLSPKIDLGPPRDSLVVEDPIATAQKLVPELRKRADVVVVLSHLGRTEGDELADRVPGIDL